MTLITSKVESLKRGESYIKHIEIEKIAGWLEKDLFEATEDMTRLSEPDALLICVPTPLNDARDPDFDTSKEPVSSSPKPPAGSIGGAGEHDLPDHDTRRHGSDSATEWSTAGDDFFVAYSPEREDPGNPDFSAAGIPKVVGAIDEESLQCACLLYESPLPGSCRSAVVKSPKRPKCWRTSIVPSTSPWSMN